MERPKHPADSPVPVAARSLLAQQEDTKRVRMVSGPGSQVTRCLMIIDRGPGDPGGKRGNLPHEPITRAILGAFYEVHRTLGSGFLESVYANALAVKLRRIGLRVERNVSYEIAYLGESVGRYIADLIIESVVVVETKAPRAIEPVHRAQVVNYLRASRLEVGLLLNFGPSPQFKRVVLTANRGRVRTFGRE